MDKKLTRRSLASGMATLPILAGCSPLGIGQSDRSSDEIVLWYWNRSIDPEGFRQFERDNSGITVNDQLVGGDYASRFNTVLAGRTNIPDVAALNDDIARYFPDENRFTDLYDLGAAELEPNYLEWKWRTGMTPEGKMIGFPMDTGPLALFYREDMFAAAGLPNAPDEVTALLPEWEDLFGIATDIETANPGVKLLDNVQYTYLFALMQSQVFYVDEESRYVGDGPSVRRAWDLTLEANEMNVGANIRPFTPDWSAGVDESRFACFIGAVWMKQFLSESGDATRGRWRVAQLPGGPGNQGGSFISITEAARDKEKAWALISRIMDAEHQTAQYRSLSLFPSALESLDDDVMSEEEDFFGGQPTGIEFVQTAKNLQPFYFNPEYPICHTIMNEEVTNIVITGKDPGQAWDDAQKRIRREVAHKAPWVSFEDSEEG